MAIIDAGQAELTEVFFPYLLDSNNETTYRAFVENQKLLEE